MELSITWIGELYSFTFSLGQNLCRPVLDDADEPRGDNSNGTYRERAGKESPAPDPEEIEVGVG